MVKWFLHWNVWRPYHLQGALQRFSFWESGLWFAPFTSSFEFVNNFSIYFWNFILTASSSLQLLQLASRLQPVGLVTRPSLPGSTCENKALMSVQGLCYFLWRNHMVTFCMNGTAFWFVGNFRSASDGQRDYNIIPFISWWLLLIWIQ